MTNELAVTKPNSVARPRRESALALLREDSHGSIATPAGEIAATAGEAIRESLKTVVGYADRGCVLNSQIDLHHKAPDGSETRATISWRYGK